MARFVFVFRLILCTVALVSAQEIERSLIELEPTNNPILNEDVATTPNFVDFTTIVDDDYNSDNLSAEVNNATDIKSGLNNIINSDIKNISSYNVSTVASQANDSVDNIATPTENRITEANSGPVMSDTSKYIITSLLKNNDSDFYSNTDLKNVAKMNATQVQDSEPLEINSVIEKVRSFRELSKIFGLDNHNIPQESLRILENMRPEDRLATALAFKKRYKIETQFDPVSFFNQTNDQPIESSENYGISIILSSDIMALTSVVESMENSLCKNQSLRLLRGLLAGKLWALKMYDASAKSPTGLLWGNTFQLGNFDECLETKSNDDQEIFPVEGQYCLAKVELVRKSLPTFHYEKRTGPREDVHWAVCVPATCSSSQIQEFVSNLLISSPGGGDVTITSNQCHRQKPLQVDSKDISFGSFMLAFSAFLVACTMFHIYIRYKNKNSPKRSPTILESAILSFSVARNLRKIFSVKKNEHGLDAISGIRTFAMFFILSGHALIFIFSGPVMNSGFYDDMLKRVENTLLLSNPLLVDSFLLISAFLFCRLLLIEFDKRKGRVNVIAIYVFRYLRVTPSYFVVIALYMTWLDKLGSGPLWDSKMELEKNRCLESWWANILYINNYIKTDNLCMFQSWYLSVDTQLFVLAPAIIYPLWKWPRAGEWILGIATCLSTIIPFIITYWNELDPTLLPYPKEVVDISTNYYFKEAYIKTHMRASAYCIGLLSGYILHKIQTTGYDFQRKHLVIGWTLAIVCGAGSVFTVSVFFQPYYQYNALYAALYSAVHRIAWAASTGWLLIVCSTKHGGPFGKIFLWKPLIPLGRLTFCAYLINGLVELYSVGTLRDSVHLSVYGLTALCFSHILQTFLGALILCVMFESPIHGFERILLKALGNHKNFTSESRRDLESSHK